MDRPLTTSWWRRHWMQTAVFIAAASAILLTARLFLGPRERTVHVPLAQVTVAKVERGTFHDFVPLRGQIAALDTTYVDALEGGRVERIRAQAGDPLVKGQPLVDLSNTELELDVLDREGRLIESITQLQTYQTQLEQNRLNNEKALAQIQYDIIRLNRSLQRSRPLAVQGLVSRESKESLEDELDHDAKLEPLQLQSNQKQEELRERQLPQIQTQITALQDDLRITHSKLDNLTVRAPVSGRLTAMDLKVGESRSRGERIAEITPDTGYKLVAVVDEYYLQRVHPNQGADVEVEDNTYPLKITRVYPQVKDGAFSVDLAFVGAAPEGIIPGQGMRGRLSLGADEIKTTLQAGAFLERSGGDWVFVLDPGQRAARRHTVKIGRRNAEQVEVLSGLSPGDEVIISDYTGFEEIDRVELDP